ncbi:hypothetical protein [Emcibacter nanhaiensis]|uniref:Uncharacterized protein n=1 Tax=Emcibacter nanhaiensis TaxID=1505037 RepID=A0A501PEZ3_9PROT|nr:hypothetical protein [Emcibacter nanhaiensis]TPD58990.1 hypothetical protein FIV46_12195 [Emcibacter nanhaiensis]
MAERMKLIAFRAPVSVHDQIRTRAQKESKSLTAVIREMLQRSLDDQTIRNVLRQQQQMEHRLKTLEQAALENNAALRDLKQPVDSLHQMFRHLLETLTEKSQRRLP